jgi:hypothetical protein
VRVERVKRERVVVTYSVRRMAVLFFWIWIWLRLAVRTRVKRVKGLLRLGLRRWWVRRGKWGRGKGKNRVRRVRRVRMRDGRRWERPLVLWSRNIFRLVERVVVLALDLALRDSWLDNRLRVRLRLRGGRAI